jgi:hypothetical protein
MGEKFIFMSIRLRYVNRIAMLFNGIIAHGKKEKGPMAGRNTACDQHWSFIG